MYDAGTTDCVGRPAADVLTVEHDQAGVGRHQTRQGAREAALAGTVGPEHGEALAARHLQRDIGQADRIAVPNRQVLDDECELLVFLLCLLRLLGDGAQAPPRRGPGSRLVRGWFCRRRLALRRELFAEIGSAYSWA